MDVLSHGLWGVALARHRVRWWLAALSGAVPDVVAFGPARVVELLEGRLNYRHEVRPMEDYPAVTEHLYRGTHGLLAVAAAAALCYALFRLFPALAKRVAADAGEPPGPGVLAGWIAAPWALHLLMDVPFHTADFFPTPLLWPFSDAVFDGIPWAQPLVVVPNLALLALALWWTWPRPDSTATPRPSEP